MTWFDHVVAISELIASLTDISELFDGQVQVCA